MKFTAVLMVAACLQVSGRGYGQGRISLHEKDASILSLVKEIARQAGYKYILNDQWAGRMKPVTIDTKNATVEEALDKCFEGQPYTYSIVNTTIIVKERPSTEKNATEGSPPPTDIKGKVLNDKGEPVPGASVFLHGTNTGTNTDDNGDFILKSNSNDATLEIKSIGYFDTLMTVAAGQYVFVHLRTKIIELGQAVVAVSNGYQQIPKERATGSFAFVDNQLFNRKVSTDVLGRLEGVVPGLLINRNVSTINNPNGIDISIRGFSTLFSNAQPLIVVDNFPYDGAISNINPNDVESITILKDAAAASIWGVQSGNGVIVITTKRGKRNQRFSVETNANISIVNKSNLYYSSDFLPSKEFIAVERTLFDQGYYDDRLSNSARPPVSPVVQILADQRSGLLTNADADTRIASLSNIDVRDGLSKLFYRKSIQEQYSVNFKGGTDKLDYIFSLGYDKNLDGLVGNKNERLSIGSRNNFYPTKHLTLTAELNYVQASIAGNSPVNNIYTGGGYSNIYPYAQLVDNNGRALSIVKDYNYRWVTDPNAQAGLLDWQYKPLDELNYADNTNKVYDNRLLFGFKYSFPAGISMETKYQFERSTSQTENYYSDSSYFARNLINQFTDFTASNAQGNIYPIPVGGILNQSQSNIVSHRIRSQINYSSNWSSIHQVNAIVGGELSQRVNTIASPSTTYGYNKNTGVFQSVDFVDYYATNPTNNALQIPNNQSYYKFTNRLISYFANAAYTFNSLYTVTASGRVDKSNLFGVSTNQKSVPLYSAGLLWNVSNEKFYHVKFLSYLKLRATFGYNGNINTSATAIPTIQEISRSFYFGLPYYRVANPGNPELRWEKVRQTNLEVEFSTRNGTISGSFDYFFKRGTDLFGNAILPSSTGWTTFYGNTANTKGRGFDLQINVSLIKTNNLRWNAIFLLSNALDKVTKYDVKSDASNYLLATADAATITPVTGKPIFSIFSYSSAGLNHDTGDPQGFLNGKLSTDYASIIGNTTVDSLKFFGSARPTTFGSFRNTFTFNALTVSFNIIYKLNYYFRRSSISYIALFDSWKGNKDYLNRWQKPGDENVTSIPSMPTVSNLDPNREQFYAYSQSLVDKGDHIRLQDISISYDLSQKLMKGVFSRVQIYGYINNVGILWRANKNHLDPDIPSASMPAPRSYAIGIKSNF